MSKPSGPFPAVVYTHNKGQSSWNPLITATSIANLFIVQDSNDPSSFRLTAKLADNGKCILDAPIYKDYRFQTDLSQPKFHKLKIDKYYGFNFVEENDAKMFEREMRVALLKAKSSPTSLSHANSTSGDKLTHSDKNKSKEKKSHPNKSSHDNPSRVKSMMIETVPLDSPTSRSKPPTPIGDSKQSNSKSHVVDPLDQLEQKYLTQPPKAQSTPNSLGSKVVGSNTSPTPLTRPNFVFTPVKLDANHKTEKPTPQPQTSPSAPVDSSDIRAKVIEEIFTTEHEYVNSLTLLREMYYLPLKYCHRLGVDVMTKDDFGKIFYGFETIYQLNEKFLHDLEEHKANGTISNTIGQLFKLYAPSMKLYIDYVNRYETALQTIQKLRESSQVFEHFLEENQKDPDSQRRNIQDFLIMPIQRIPRYVLLLAELLKKTEVGHRDYMNIKHALEDMEKIATYINEKKRMYENQEMVSKIQERFSPKDPPLLKENRSFILEAKMYITDPEFVPPKNPLKKKKNKEPAPEQLGLQECYFFLFTDICLWGVQQKQYLVQRNRIKLIDIVSIDIVNNYKVDFYDIVEPWKGFSISTEQGLASTFYTNNFELFDKVIQQLQDAFEKERTLKGQELQRRRPLTTVIEQ